MQHVTNTITALLFCLAIAAHSSADNVVEPGLIGAPIELDDESLRLAPPAASPAFLAMVRSGFSLDHHVDQERVQAEIRWLQRNPRYMRNIAPRMERYLPYVCDETLKRDIPAEICLLPIIESALDPFAFSPGGAAGLWQFIPATAKRYRLKIDWWVDERRDPVASTDAALRYLTDLEARFDDWLLAVAAYNWGEGKVARAKRRAGERATFFDLKVPRETASYVPRLLAFAAVFDDPARHGVELHGAIAEDPNVGVAFEAVATHGQIDVAKAAEATGIAVEDIYRFNPALNQWATHPNGPHRLLVPATQASTAKAALDAVPSDQRLRWARHRVGERDTLGHLAKRYHTDVATLKRVNNLRGDIIRAGEHLLIPRSKLADGDYPTPVRRREGRGTAYFVKAGDSLWEIGQAHGVSVGALMRANHVGPNDVLRVGQRLVIPGRGGDIVRSVRYRVRSGDSLAKIAGKFNVTVADIVGWNKIDPGRYIQPGQKLLLYVNVTAPRS